MSKPSQPERSKTETAQFPVDAPTSHSLRCSIHAHLKKLGFSRNRNGYFILGNVSKDTIRSLHSEHRRDVLSQNRDFVYSHGLELAQHFATGAQVNPVEITPELIEVTPGSPEARLFRFASLLWSVPVSQGFGRRLRFLVQDRQNGKLIGLFALGDPVFNLSARDNWIGWTNQMRLTRLVHVMDAYVVGAVPPYSHLIGGKLIAALMGSRDVRQVYERKYLGLESVITKTTHRARLVLLTTTSSLGRSSIYNRLSIPQGPTFVRIGTTKGFGHFHLSGPIFEKMRHYLKSEGHPYASGHRYGMGPNWKLRVARAALEGVGLNGNGILKHGIEREVYAIPLAHNWKEVLLGTHCNVRAIAPSAADISEYCVSRWMVPRAERDKRYKRISRRAIMDYLTNDDT